MKKIIFVFLIGCSFKNNSNSSSSQSEAVVPLMRTWTDSNGNTYLPDMFYKRVLKVDSSGIVTLLFGNSSNQDDCTVEAANLAISSQQPGSVALGSIEQLIVSSTDEIYISTSCNGDGHIYKYTLGQENPFSRIAGVGIPDEGSEYAVEGDEADQHIFYSIQELALDSQEKNLFIATEHVILKIDLETKIITTMAGYWGQSETNFSGEGVPALEALFYGPNGIAMFSDGSYYVADSANRRIRYIDINGIVTTIAGSEEVGCVDGVGDAAQFISPRGMVLDPTGQYLYITDRGCDVVRQLNLTTREVTTLAGALQEGDSLPPAGNTPSLTTTLLDARFHNPMKIMYNPLADAYYVFDEANDLFRGFSVTNNEVFIFSGGGELEENFGQPATDIHMYLYD